ncbi:hypothetical protein FB451DRAFT_1191839 [Mycena latifolia]|nr:hypothetical protein FB451DRAFT_1191839 [Mycena latifolia]
MDGWEIPLAAGPCVSSIASSIARVESGGGRAGSGVGGAGKDSEGAGRRFENAGVGYRISGGRAALPAPLRRKKITFGGSYSFGTTQLSGFRASSGSWQLLLFNMGRKASVLWSGCYFISLHNLALRAFLCAPLSAVASELRDDDTDVKHREVRCERQEDKTKRRCQGQETRKKVTVSVSQNETTEDKDNVTVSTHVACSVSWQLLLFDTREDPCFISCCCIGAITGRADCGRLALNTVPFAACVMARLPTPGRDASDARFMYTSAQYSGSRGSEAVVATAIVRYKGRPLLHFLLLQMSVTRSEEEENEGPNEERRTEYFFPLPVTATSRARRVRRAFYVYLHSVLGVSGFMVSGVGSVRRSQDVPQLLCGMGPPSCLWTRARSSAAAHAAAHASRSWAGSALLDTSPQRRKQAAAPLECVRSPHRKTLKPPQPPRARCIRAPLLTYAPALLRCAPRAKCIRSPLKTAPGRVPSFVKRPHAPLGCIRSLQGAAPLDTECVRPPLLPPQRKMRPSSSSAAWFRALLKHQAPQYLLGKAPALLLERCALGFKHPPYPSRDSSTSRMHPAPDSPLNASVLLWRAPAPARAPAQRKRGETPPSVSVAALPHAGGLDPPLGLGPPHRKTRPPFRLSFVFDADIRLWPVLFARQLAHNPQRAFPGNPPKRGAL